MRKFALLIGVTDYEEPGLEKLPAVEQDVKEMARVLQNPDMGGFAEENVQQLLNPDLQRMREEIYKLFDNRKNDDLIVLYFSGHGIKHQESGKLYFATSKTKGDSLWATAVEASFVHQYMNESKSKRQVVILDCCFSGAFSEGMLLRNFSVAYVDIEQQLGGEGRAVLTSSTSTQYTFDGVYTRCLVEGIETGEADENGDDWISVGELHHYAKNKVYEATSSKMKPEIYPIREGSDIRLAQAPKGDPKLKYRKAVEDYATRDGEISDICRQALEVRREELDLSPEDANAIEANVFKDTQKSKAKLQKYETIFAQAIQRECPLSEDTSNGLKHLQKALRLTDEDIAKIENTLIQERQRKLQDYQQAFAQTIKRGYPVSDVTRAELKLIQERLKLRDEDIAPIEASLIQVSDKNIRVIKKYFVPMGLSMVAIIGFAVFYFGGNTTTPTLSEPKISKSCQNDAQPVREAVTSLGEKILVRGNSNRYKKAGVEAFAKRDFKTAIDEFKTHLTACKNDPEALIYSNNALVAQKGNSLKIAVSVPIGSNLNVAEEILRGVGQAQNEVNNNGGINGKLLLVEIANDNNDSNIAPIIAYRFVKDTKILAVVGHNASNASINAASKYQEGGLVMIAPTGFSDSLSNFGKYIFRTVPKIDLSADKLAEHIIKTVDKTNIAICLDSKALDNESFRDNFVRAMVKAGGTINSTDCDLSVDGLNADAIISQAINSGASALLLSPHIDRIDKAIKFAKAANERRLPIFSSPTLYTYETLEKGKADVNGMVLTTPWHPQAFPSNSFAKNAQQLWGATVNWRTATAYDATRAIITGLQQSNTRPDLQKVLRNLNFSADGAMGKIQFESSGDRKGNFVLIKVQPSTENKTGYDFVWLPPDRSDASKLRNGSN